ncbi:MAG: hypothetical protein AVDCRST_MAG89-2280 [uncultured Gemmatimonadetes bacterium]|uniref:Uncharacterized protein n=1 Tax=uncultured Gemmatimonadota bacterium TaxID=203437 RepID=A0A6J4LIR5_9BACT|nr:MAG: hypothetical protein AVDCRST_MAG89-2280 [uncultured Gemmatimonadota bacterium]
MPRAACAPIPARFSRVILPAWRRVSRRWLPAAFARGDSGLGGAVPWMAYNLNSGVPGAGGA